MSGSFIAISTRATCSGFEIDSQGLSTGSRRASVHARSIRLNLFQYNPKMADDLRDVWEQRSGLTFDPWADLVSIIGTLDNIRGSRHPNAATWSIEQALKNAVNALS